ncbi:unnamed protein product [Microthlaspi erraticum]|uniref:Senescence domain-containing protein n=1 Tax=Microthlaspi erraticum TaxID=1685480 RepID=A0A6D2JE61_9BRAS|nr:unnamed protein product [Microthlaspi erraticum]
METSATPELDPTVDTTTTDAPPVATEEVILTIHGAILHLIDKSCSVELAVGDLEILRLVQDDITIAVFARVAKEIQWPLTKDSPAVKVDESHYFFSLPPVKESESETPEDHSTEEESVEMLNYGLTIASKGQEPLLEKLDQILTDYNCFTEEKHESEEETGEDGNDENVLELTAAKETSPEELKGKRKKMVKKECTAYWTALAPNVEDYSGDAAKAVAAGTGQLIKGILWCGDVAIDRLMWGNEFMKRKLTKAEKERKVHPKVLKSLKRVRKITKMTEKVANMVLSGVLRYSGMFSSSVKDSKAGKKLFTLLPGEVAIATLDGFYKVCDAVEFASRNVLKTSLTVTTDVIDHKYGADVAQATNDGLGAGGHVLGTAWTVYKIKKVINPKSFLKFK